MLNLYMSQILRDFITNRVYQEIDPTDPTTPTGQQARWIFDFKGISLEKSFLQEYARCFWSIFREKYPGGIQVGGMETGAIALIAGIVAFAPTGVLVSGFYIRKSRKKHDLANQVEGEVRPDLPIILVDDILNAGKTIRKQRKILEEMGFRVSALFVCLRFRDRSWYQDLLDAGVEIESIFELNDFQKVLPVKNFVSDEVHQSQLKKYSVDYKVQLTKKPNLYAVVPKSAPLLVGEYLYMGVDDGSFYCLKARDGSVVWKYKVFFGADGKYIFSSPCIFQDTVIFGAYDGNLYGLDRFSGKRRWVFSDADWIGSSPCVNERAGLVYVGLEFGLFQKHGGVAAIHAKTGKLCWGYYKIPGLVHASPAYSQIGKRVVCGSNDHHLYAFDALSGKLLWKYETEGEVKYRALFDEERGLVIFGGMDGHLYALKEETGELTLSFQARYGFYSTPVLKDHLVIAGSLDKNVYAFNLKTKQAEWTFETRGRIFSSPVIDGESVFIGSNDGCLYELDSTSGKLLAVIQLTERIVNAVQITHEHERRVLYIPTHVGELYRFHEEGSETS